MTLTPDTKARTTAPAKPKTILRRNLDAVTEAFTTLFEGHLPTLRRALQFTQKKTAELLGVSRMHWSRYESGEYPIPVATDLALRYLLLHQYEARTGRTASPNDDMLLLMAALQRMSDKDRLMTALKGEGFNPDQVKDLL
jgi:transcriptional regulator with XRE-family HTH domain